MEYRYMIWNNVQKEYQFSSICETTSKGAETLLFKIIGNDARKWRFEIKQVPKDEAYLIRKKLKYKNKTNRIHQEIPNIDYKIIYDLVVKNDEVAKQEVLK